MPIVLLSTLVSFGCRESARVAKPDSTSPMPAPTQRVVRQVDHILIQSLEAEALFSLLAETLRLPVAWPMSDYDGFASGGVAFGNVNVEILKASDPKRTAPASRCTGFALEPEPLGDSLPELRRRGIRFDRPVPYRATREDGTVETLWTTVGLPSVSNDATDVFICEYRGSPVEHRQRWLEELRSRSGGPLSIRSVREIVCGTTDEPALRARWRELLDPIEAASPGSWPVGDGPAIRVMQAPADGILQLVIEVESLPRARAFLAEHGLLREEGPKSITLGGRELEGVTIRCVQADDD